MPLSMSVDLASRMAAGAAHLIFGTPEVSSNGLLFFSMQFSHLCMLNVMVLIDPRVQQNICSHHPIINFLAV